MSDGQARIDVLEAVLRACRDYFYAKAKADWPHGDEKPNEEMRMLSRIERVLRP